MKKLYLIIVFFITINIHGFSQEVLIIYDNLSIERVISLKGYNLQSVVPYENEITIVDSVFFNNVKNSIQRFQKCDTCEGVMSVNLQLILIDYQKGYDVINMFYSHIIDDKCFYMGLNGKPIIPDPHFQKIIEEIVRYYEQGEKRNFVPKDFIAKINKKF